MIIVRMVLMGLLMMFFYFSMVVGWCFNCVCFNNGIMMVGLVIIKIFFNKIDIFKERLVR